jgi:hypothetical protein
MVEISFGSRAAVAGRWIARPDMRMSMRWLLPILLVLLVNAFRPATAETVKGCNQQCAEFARSELLVCSGLMRSNLSCPLFIEKNNQLCLQYCAEHEKDAEPDDTSTAQDFKGGCDPVHLRCY